MAGVSDPGRGGDGLYIALASPYSAELAACLEGRLPPAAVLVDAASAAADASALARAEIAFGAPDRLLACLPAMPALRWMQSTWAGVTPLIRQPRRDFVLTGVKGVFGRSMAEYVLGWSLALRRSILHYASASRWEFRRDAGLSTLSLGVAGAGSIGAEVALRCAPFFARVVGLNSDGRDVEGFDRCFAAGERCAFARGVDVLAILLPDTPSTTGLIDAAVLRSLNPGAIVINAGRANALVLDDALEALRIEQLSAAVLDVFEKEPLPDDSPLWTTPRLHITSHSAAPTSIDDVTDLFCANLERYLSGRELFGRIDMDRGY
ncbi:MAG: D-2-hydroxyacid dehydrogenase [Halieaceae bacterium]|jgi:phosphoglycerate dehydrogenase-like enzyme|nr:D-2-hydroxyacid dehydrogenase [Halieaceae bacterium]